MDTKEEHMNATILPESLRKLAGNSAEPLRLTDPQTNAAYVLISETLYDRVRKLLEVEEDRVLQEGWQKLANRGIALAADEEP